MIDIGDLKMRQAWLDSVKLLGELQLVFLQITHHDGHPPACSTDRGGECGDDLLLRVWVGSWG